MTGTRYRTLKDQLEAEIANAERRAYNPWQQTERLRAQRDLGGLRLRTAAKAAGAPVFEINRARDIADRDSDERWRRMFDIGLPGRDQTAELDCGACD